MVSTVSSERETSAVTSPRPRSSRRKGREGLLEPRAELVQPRRLAGHADRPLVTAKAHEHVGALLDGMEQIDRADGAPGAARQAVGHREHDRGDVVAAHQARGDDALDALVPALAAHHHGAAAIVDARGLGEGGLGEGGLDRAALGVDGLEARREHRRPRRDRR